MSECIFSLLLLDVSVYQAVVGDNHLRPHEVLCALTRSGWGACPMVPIRGCPWAPLGPTRGYSSPIQRHADGLTILSFRPPEREKTPREGRCARIPLKHMILQSLPDVGLLSGIPPQPTHNIAPHSGEACAVGRGRVPLPGAPLMCQCVKRSSETTTSDLTKYCALWLGPDGERAPWSPPGVL